MTKPDRTYGNIEIGAIGWMLKETGGEHDNVEKKSPPMVDHFGRRSCIIPDDLCRLAFCRAREGGDASAPR